MQDTINIAAVDDLPADLERLMDRLLRRLRLEEYIDLSATAASVRVPADEVLYAEVLNHRMRLLTRAGEFLLRMTVEELKPMLPKDGRFYECHRGIVINLDAVGTLEAQVVVMENGGRLPVSRRRRPSLEQAYAERSIARVRSELWWNCFCIPRAPGCRAIFWLFISTGISNGAPRSSPFCWYACCWL